MTWDKLYTAHIKLRIESCVENHVLEDRENLYQEINKESVPTTSVGPKARTPTSNTSSSMAFASLSSELLKFCMSRASTADWRLAKGQGFSSRLPRLFCIFAGSIVWRNETHRNKILKLDNDFKINMHSWLSISGLNDCRFKNKTVRERKINTRRLRFHDDWTQKEIQQAQQAVHFELAVRLDRLNRHSREQSWSGCFAGLRN